MEPGLGKIKLLKNLLAGEKVPYGPFRVQVDLTRRCNLRCPACRFHGGMQGDDGTDLEMSLFEKICRELGEMETKSLLLTGAGEPFLHPRLFDMIATAKQARLHVVLVTNGTLLDRDRIEGVVHSGLDVLRVSSWGIGGGEEAGGNRGGEWGLEPETLSKTLKNLSRVKVSRRKRKPIVVLHRPLHRLNFDTAEAACDLALGTGCEGVTFSPLKPIGGRLSALALQPEEERRVRSGLRRIRSRLRSKGLRGNVDEVLLRYRIGEEVWRKLPCYVPWYHTRIATDGAVIPCEGCDLPLGNVRDQPLREIWNHREYRGFRRKARTREGLRSLEDRCDCRFCCHVFVNSKIHGVMRWMGPLGLMKNRRTVEP